MNEKRRDQKFYYIIFGVFILILLLVVGYFVFYKNDGAETSIEKEEATENVDSGGEIDISNWQTYENEEYGFSLKYPEGWEKNEVDETRILLSGVYKEFSPQIRVEGELIVELFESNNQSLNEWINNYKKLDEGLDQKSEKEIKIDSENGIERVIILNHDKTEYREIFLKKDGYIYNIHPNIVARFPDKSIEKENINLVEKGEKEVQLILESINFN